MGDGAQHRLSCFAVPDIRALRDGSVQAVKRRIAILQVLARHGAVRVTEIAAELDVCIRRYGGQRRAYGTVASIGRPSRRQRRPWRASSRELLAREFRGRI
jgi:hypothetical protein